MVHDDMESQSHFHAEVVVRRFRQAYQDRQRGIEPLDEWEARYRPLTDAGHSALALLRQRNERLPMLMLLPGLMLATPREQHLRHQDMVSLAANTVPESPPSPHAMWTLLEATSLLVPVDAWRAHALAERSLDLALQCRPLLGDDRWLYRAWCQQAITHLIHAKVAAGAVCLDQARALEQPHWPALFRRQRWLVEAWLADRHGDGQGVYLASLELQRLSRPLGPWGWASGLSLVNGAMAAGRFDEAVAQGLAAVARLEGGPCLGALTETRVQLIGALVATGRLVEARQHSRAAWPHVATFARMDVWADYQALLMALEGRAADAARLLGHADELCRRDQLERCLNERHAAQRTRELVAARLTAGELQALLAEGARLRPDEVPALAFAPEDGRAGTPD